MTEDPDMTALEVRLRELMSGLDTREGFEARVQARIATARPRADLRAQFERRREFIRRRLRREAWANGVSVAGIGIAAAVLVWRFSQEIGQFAGSLAASVDPLVIGAATLAAVALGLWPYLRKLPGRR